MIAPYLFAVGVLAIVGVLFALAWWLCSRVDLD